MYWSRFQIIPYLELLLEIKFKVTVKFFDVQSSVLIISMYISDEMYADEKFCPSQHKLRLNFYRMLHIKSLP